MKIIYFVIVEDGKDTWESNAVTELGIIDWLKETKKFHNEKGICTKIIIRGVFELEKEISEEEMDELFHNACIRVKN